MRSYEESSRRYVKRSQTAAGAAVSVLMISERDIWLAAKAFIRRHGENAGIEAAARADEHLEHGDTEGSALWKRDRGRD